MNKFIQKECESSCEYTLPDYMGDVKRILSVSASVIPSGKFVSDSEAEFSGVVAYDVLYSDSEGKLTKINTTSDYDIFIPISSDTYKDCIAEPSVLNFGLRLLGPRRLTAKSVVAGNIRLSQREDFSSEGDAFDTAVELESVSTSVCSERTLFGISDEREFAEEAERVVASSVDGIEILTTSGYVRILESQAKEDGVLVKGELVITAIIRVDGEPPFAIKKTIPFEEKVTIEGMSSDMQAMADGYVTSLTAGVSGAEDGCIVTVNAIAEFYAMASENIRESVITDAYIKNRDTDVKYEDFTYTELLSMGVSEGTFATDFSRAELGLENAREILSIGCEYRSLEKKCVENKIEISGDVIVSGVACEINEQNTPAYIPFKVTSPFLAYVNCGCQIPENNILECRISTADVKYTLEAERLKVEPLIKASYRILKEERARRVSECNALGDNVYEKDGSCVTVYYPDVGESLFEIAKKFHTTGAKIAADNKLSESTLLSSDKPTSLDGVKRLIIK